MAQSPWADRIDPDMQRLIDAGHFAGVATEIWHQGKLAHRSALGLRDLADAAPMTPDTIVRIFSMTKPVTAAAMMILHDQGKWRAEDPLAKHLPDLANLQVCEGIANDQAIIRPARSQPTMGQLLTHTAGFSYGFEPGWVDDRYREADLWRAIDLQDFVRRVAQLPLASDPGTRWQYGISMDLEGAIVERLSGMSLGEFCRGHIFEPLAMPDTDFYVPLSKVPRLATLYARQAGRLERADNPLGEHVGSPSDFASGGGGLYSTAIDYARFGRMLLGHGEFEGQRIMSAGAAQAMMSRQIAPSIVEGGFGIGFQQIRPGYEFGYNGIVVTNPAMAGVSLGLGSYLWDGLAGTWFWVDPENEIAFVGMVQRIVDPLAPLVQPIAQDAVRDILRSTSLDDRSRQIAYRGPTHA